MRKQVLSLLSVNFSKPRPVPELGKVIRFINEEVNDPFLQEELRRQLRDFENRLNFSLVMKQAYPKNLIMYDIDTVAFLVLREDGVYRGLRPLGAFELKFKNWRTLSDEGIPVNGMQYRALETFSLAYGIPLYYIVNLSWRKIALWRVGKFEPKYQVRGKGLARDFYAVISWDDVKLIKPSKLPHAIPNLIEGKEVV